MYTTVTEETIAYMGRAGCLPEQPLVVCAWKSLLKITITSVIVSYVVQLWLTAGSTSAMLDRHWDVISGMRSLSARISDMVEIRTQTGDWGAAMIRLWWFREWCERGARLENTTHRPNAGPMLGRRRRRWPNIVPTFGRCVVFAGRARHCLPQLARATTGLLSDSRSADEPNPVAVTYIKDVL